MKPYMEKGIHNMKSNRYIMFSQNQVGGKDKKKYIANVKYKLTKETEGAFYIGKNMFRKKDLPETEYTLGNIVRESYRD